MRLPRLRQLTGAKIRAGRLLTFPAVAGLALGSALVAAFAPRAAQAHIRMTAPAGWVMTDSDGDPQKVTPCGVDSTVTYTPTNAVTTVHAGDKVTVNWIETIPHDGHFRISLAINSRNELLDPAVTQMNSDDTAAQVAISNPPVYPVLADNLFQHTAAQTSPGKTYTTTVTIPSNMTCTKCTLQLLQFMANHPPDPSYFYHQCADFTILAASGSGGGGATGAGGASATGAGGTSATGTGGTNATGTGGTNAIGTGGTNTTGAGGTNATGTGGTNATGTGGTSATGTGGTNATGAGGSGIGGSAATGTGGGKGSGGASANGGASGGGSTGSGGDTATTSSGCSCATGGAGAGGPALMLLGFGFFVLARGRRSRR